MKRGADLEFIFLTVLLTVIMTKAVNELWDRFAKK